MELFPAEADDGDVVAEAVVSAGAAAPHFAQNFAFALSGAPQSLHFRATSCVPHSEQNRPVPGVAQLGQLTASCGTEFMRGKILWWELESHCFYYDIGKSWRVASRTCL